MKDISELTQAEIDEMIRQQSQKTISKNVFDDIVKHHLQRTIDKKPMPLYGNGFTLETRLTKFLNSKKLTPTQAALLVCGIQPQEDCIIHCDAITLNGELVKAHSPEMYTAEKILNRWNRGINPPAEIALIEFIEWCKDNDINTEWVTNADEWLDYAFNQGLTTVRIKNDLGSKVFKVNWGHYLSLDKWTPEQAICLLHEIDYDKMGNDNCKKYFLDLLQIAKVKGDLIPYEWVEFAKKNELDIPDKLQGIKCIEQKEPEVVEDVGLVSHARTEPKERELTVWLRETWIKEGKLGGTAFFTKLKKHVNTKGSPIIEYYSAGKVAGIKWETSAGNRGEMTKKTISNKVSIFKSKP